jgi:hypothetical protein
MFSASTCLFARRSFDAPWSSPALSNVMFAYEKYYNLGSFTKLFIKADSNRYQIAKEFYDFKIPVADYLRVGGGIRLTVSSHRRPLRLPEQHRTPFGNCFHKLPPIAG